MDRPPSELLKTPRIPVVVAPLPDMSVVNATSTNPEHGASLREQAERAGSALRAALEALVLEIVGATPRPGRLISETGLDKSLAGRIIRTARSPNPLAVLLHTPAASGLGMFMDAAKRTTGSATSLERLQRAIGEYEQLLARFPSGRTGLEAAISGWMPETREQGERAARQSVFNAMSYLFGHQSDATLGMTILVPNVDGRTLDVTMVNGQFGLRRLREGEAMTVFGMRYYPLAQAGAGTPNPTTVEGQSIEIESCVMEEFCTPTPPALRLVKNGDQRMFVLPAGEPELNHPMTVVSAYKQTAAWQRYATAARSEEWQTIMTRRPTRVLINDTFIHADVFPDVEPVITTHMAGLSPLPARELGSGYALDEIQLSLEAGWVGAKGKCDLRNLGTGDVPRHPEIAEAVFARLGQDPAKFRVHRLRIAYPVPSIAATRWFKLPQPPQDVER